MKNHVLTALLAMSILFVGCGKDGDVGSQGPAGPAGANGNANVNSTVFTIQPGDWSAAGTAGTDYAKYKEISMPEINQDIIDNGSVMVYMQASGYSIPLPFNVPSVGSAANYSFVVTNGIVEIDVTLDNHQSFSVNQALDFKVTVIEGN